ncbi:Ribonuclease 1 [Apostasia shenzhenica]|uniref:Ribonuclease 1 n=1 Tax=Apostasia shenzhenica TaxID=1088818 RepID=A0A2I0BFR7_9ASPA|nr:Ribonuclease 1 [Apostasia shenzhenica]
MHEEWPTLACPRSDGRLFWQHEWEKHGTCAESVLSQHAYFQAALGIKNNINFLHILKNVNSIKGSIGQATGFAPWIECNVVEEGNSQPYQVYMCVGPSASRLIDCPVLPRGSCAAEIEFPSFYIQL